MGGIYIAIGAISAALIAAAVSLAGLIISKESKVSEFRHLWIQELRICVADLIGCTIALTGQRQALGSDEVEVKEVVSSIEDFQNAFTKISELEMRLNPTEHSELIRLLQSLSSKLTNSTDFLLKPAAVGELLNLTVSETQRVIKVEWERVKRGEPIFVHLKRALVGGTLSIVITACVIVWYLMAG